MSKRSKSVADDLRRAIAQAEKRGMTRYAIAKATGLSQAMLSRFMAGENVPKLDTAERIAKAIGRRLVLANDA
jgi:transcriptional regulator with XRE-family HTH domain